MKKRNKKKPYIFKKKDAERLCDPIAAWHEEEDERILHDMMGEAEDQAKYDNHVIDIIHSDKFKEGMYDVIAKWKQKLKEDEE